MRTILILSGLILSGCAGQWTKPGVDQAQAALEVKQCQTETSATYPPALVKRLSMSSTPQHQECSTQGGRTSCRTVGGAPVATPTVTDLNAPDRSIALHTCLQNRGYTYSRG